MLKIKVNKAKLQLSLNQELVKLKDNNDPVPIAPRRHPQTQPAASAFSSQPLSSQAARQLHPLVDPLLVKVRAQLALALHPSELVPVAKHQTQR